MSFVILGGFVMFAVFLGMLYLNVTTKDATNHLIEESSVGMYAIQGSLLCEQVLPHVNLFILCRKCVQHLQGLSS